MLILSMPVSCPFFFPSLPCHHLIITPFPSFLCLSCLLQLSGSLQFLLWISKWCFDFDMGDWAGKISLSKSRVRPSEEGGTDYQGPGNVWTEIFYFRGPRLHIYEEFNIYIFLYLFHLCLKPSQKSDTAPFVSPHSKETRRNKKLN